MGKSCGKHQFLSLRGNWMFGTPYPSLGPTGQGSQLTLYALFSKEFQKGDGRKNLFVASRQDIRKNIKMRKKKVKDNHITDKIQSIFSIHENGNT